MADLELEAMSIDELDALTVQLKREAKAIRDRRLAIRAERDRKVFYQNARDALERVGLNGVVVIPDTAHLSARGN